MARVISNLPNQPDLVNGFKFAGEAGAMISEEMPDADAANFASIPGYKLYETEPATAAKPAKSKGAAP